MGQQTQGHMMMPSSPTAHFIIAHTQILFALLKTRLNWPSHPAEASQGGKRDTRRRIAQVGLEFPRLKLTPQHQAPFRTRQAVAHRDHSQGPKVGRHWPFAALFDPVALPLSGPHLRGDRLHRLRLVLPLDKALPRGLAAPTRPLGHPRQRALEPHPRIMGHFGKIPKPTARNGIKKALSRPKASSHATQRARTCWSSTTSRIISQPSSGLVWKRISRGTPHLARRSAKSSSSTHSMGKYRRRSNRV